MGTSTDLNEQLAAQIEPDMEELAEEMRQIEEREWASAASVVHTEEERQAVMEAAKEVTYKSIRNGAQFTFKREVKEESLIMELITGGKDIPQTKGKGNPVQQLDGSTSPSESVTEGVDLPWLAWGAVPVEEDANRIQSDLIPPQARERAEAHAPSVVKPYVVEKLQEILGGGS